jgi:hypothetical protein
VTAEPTPDRDATAVRLPLAVALLTHGTPAPGLGLVDGLDLPDLTVHHLLACGLDTHRATWADTWDVEGCHSGWGGCDGHTGRPEISDAVWCRCGRGELLTWQPEPVEFAAAVLAAHAQVTAARLP